MSSPINPPGGPKDPSSPDELSGAEGADRSQKSQGPSEAFRQTLDRAEEAGDAPNVAGTTATNAADPLAAITDDLRAGRIDVDTAIDRLVERALESRSAEALPPARRGELEAFLRRSLADDPTLVALTGDLERGD